MKLEIKHLLPYLPYDLQTDKGQFWAICRDELVKARIDKRGTVKYKLDEIKPFLIPLSALLDPEYEKVFDEFSEREYDDLLDRIDYVKIGLQKSENLCNNLRFETMNALFANHFDVYGLIEQGLAIDKRLL